jgi:hypothetical protein
MFGIGLKIIKAFIRVALFLIYKKTGSGDTTKTSRCRFNFVIPVSLTGMPGSGYYSLSL